MYLVEYITCIYKDVGSILKVGRAQGLRDTLTRFGKASEALKMTVSDGLGGSIASAANLQKHLLIYMLQ